MIEKFQRLSVPKKFVVLLGVLVTLLLAWVGLYSVPLIEALAHPEEWSGWLA